MEDTKKIILQRYGINLDQIISNNKNRPIIHGITIDSDSTYYKDDGINIYKEGDNFILQISIIDVPEYIEYGSILDKKASIILEEGKEQSLFPTIIKRNCLSLMYRKKRLTYTLEIKLNSQAFIESRKIYPSQFINIYEYNLSKVDRILSSNKYNKNISMLSNIATKLYKNKNGCTKVLEAQEILHEIMRLANEQIALFCIERNIPIIQKRKGRNISKKYSIDSQIKYASFTSPMRKYIDLVTMRQIKSYKYGFINKVENTIYNYEETELQTICNNINQKYVPEYLLKNNIIDIILGKKSNTLSINDNIIYKIHTGNVEAHILFYVIFSLDFNDIKKDVYYALRYEKIVDNWEEKLFLFIKANLGLKIRIKNIHDRTYKKKRNTKIYSKYLTYIDLFLDEKILSCKGEKKEGETFSYKIVRQLFKKFYDHIHKNKIDVFENFRKNYKGWGYLYPHLFLLYFKVQSI